jgi:hypothetical protein
MIIQGTMTPETALPLFAICLFAYFVRGVSGFGSGLIATPLLAHFLPLTTVVPLMLVLDFTANLVMTRATQGEADWAELKPLLLAGLVGVPVGALLLIRLPPAYLLLTLGPLIIAFGLRNALGIQNTRPLARGWALPAGFLGGAISGTFGTGGPPYVIYLTRRLTDKGALRATLARLFLVEGGLRLAVFAGLGLLLVLPVWQLAVVGWGALAAGLWSGNHVHLKMSSARIFRVVGWLLVLSGTSLLVKGGLLAG